MGWTWTAWLVTNGGDEALRLAITTFVAPGTPLGCAHPSYSLYPVLARHSGCVGAAVHYNDAWTLPKDFAAQANAAGARLTCLVNPHAPSPAGSWASSKAPSWPPH